MAGLYCFGEMAHAIIGEGIDEAVVLGLEKKDDDDDDIFDVNDDDNDP